MAEAEGKRADETGSEPVRLAFLLELVRHGGEYPVTPEVSLLRAAMVCEHVQALQEEVDVVLEALLRDVAAAESTSDQPFSHGDAQQP